MLTFEEFRAIANHLNLTQQTINFVTIIRGSPPSRRVNSRVGNVTGSYPSRKMNRMVPFESHKIELSGIYALEHDPDVLEYYAQPEGKLHLQYEKNGRKVVAAHTPDFFLIRSSSMGWRECKPQETLLKLSVENPNRYSRTENGLWCCPPGERAAAEYGLFYELSTSAQINWKQVRNIKFLEDYLRSDDFAVDDGERKQIISNVQNNPGLKLIDLLRSVRNSDNVYRMVILEDIFVDLSEHVLAEPAYVPVFLNKAASFAWQELAKSDSPLAAAIEIKAGSKIEWAGKEWKVVNAGNSEVFLSETESNSLLPVRLDDFHQLAAAGKIKPVTPVRCAGSVPEPVFELYSKASEKDLETANFRTEIVHAYQNKEKHDGMPNERTLRRWIAKYKEAEIRYGCGYLGLLPQYRESGNYGSKLPLNVLEIIDDQIVNNYQTLKQKRMLEVHGQVLMLCDEQGLRGPSYKAFARYVHKMNTPDQTEKREGKRSAYNREPLYFELTMTTPKHGDRPFEICHIDHTQLDIELRCSLTGKTLGRPWLTIMTDAFSRRFVGIYLTYDPPSYRSCMMVLRDCVRRHGRFPQIIVVDNGAEFHSIYFEALLARYECIKKHRPAHKARFGSVCERLFGTTNTRFLYNLTGNTQIMKHVRQVYKSINPQELSGWTIEALFEALAEFAFEINDTILHPALGITPREAFMLGIQQGGQRECRIIPYNQDFLLWTMPTTPKKSVKVIPARGVKVNHLYYWNASFVQPDVEGSQVPIRYDPYDAGTVWCFVNKTWLQCQSEFFTTFQGRTEREIRYATTELKKRLKTSAGESSLTARRLASFIKTLELTEDFLLFKLREAANRYIINVITNDHGFAAQPAIFEGVLSGVNRLALPLPSQDLDSDVSTTEDQTAGIEILASETPEIYEEM